MKYTQGGYAMTINRLFLIFAALAVVLLFPYSGYASENGKLKLMEFMSNG